MKTPLALSVLLLALCACSGASFSSTTDPPDAAGDVLDAQGDAAPDALADVVVGDGGPDEGHDVGAADAPSSDAQGDAKDEADSADGCAPAAHDDGFGEHWTDCTPLGTYTFAEAMQACATHTGDAKYCADLGVGTFSVCSNQNSYPVCACWAYAGALDVGYVNHGQFGCHPPGGNLGTDTQWN